MMGQGRKSCGFCQLGVRDALGRVRQRHFDDLNVGKMSFEWTLIQ